MNESRKEIEKRVTLSRHNVLGKCHKVVLMHNFITSFCSHSSNCNTNCAHSKNYEPWISERMLLNPCHLSKYLLSSVINLVNQPSGKPSSHTLPHRLLKHADNGGKLGADGRLAVGEQPVILRLHACYMPQHCQDWQHSLVVTSANTPTSLTCQALSKEKRDKVKTTCQVKPYLLTKDFTS